MMKTKILMFALVLSAVSSFFGQAAWALLLTSSVVFPPNTAVKDERSGNGIDYMYAHTFSAPSGAEILSGKLKLTHSGNLDEGPRQELWSAFSKTGTLLGKLGFSESGPRTDEWALSAPVLDEFLKGGWQLGVGLSEQTVFNSELIRLFRSDLEIDYKVPESRPVTVPEPGGAFLLGIGLFLAETGRRIRAVRFNKNSV